MIVVTDIARPAIHIMCDDSHSFRMAILRLLGDNARRTLFDYIAKRVFVSFSFHMVDRLRIIRSIRLWFSVVFVSKGLT